MIYQHRCRVRIEPEDVQFAREAMCTPGMVTQGEDLTLGEATLWDGSIVSIQLRGVPKEPAIMIAAVFNHSGDFMSAARSTTYCTGFDFEVKGVQYMISMYAEKALANETPKPATKTQPRSKQSPKRQPWSR